jgi:ribonucleoside-triphosphate reductase
LSAWYEYGGMDPAEDLYEVEYEDGKKEIVHKYSLSELDHSCIKCTKKVDDIPRYEGRLNLGAISLNFPMIVAQSKEENKDFFDLLTYYLDLSRKIHLRTIEYFSHKKAGINPLAFCEGGAYKGHKNPDEELGREFLRPFTVSFGITALNEATVMYNGKTIYEDKSDFAEKVLRHINDYANRRKKEDGVLYAIYGTPAESLCGLQVKQFRKKYGIVKGVSDREYFSNSFHMHVSEDITPIEKQDAEYKCFHLSNGGNIMYNRFTSDSNKEAYVTLIRRAMRMGYYYGCNQSKDYCTKCGSEFMDMDSCPNCGSDDIVRIERVCGYLGFSRVGDKTRMNDCKLEEIKDRKSM